MRAASLACLLAVLVKSGSGYIDVHEQGGWEAHIFEHATACRANSERLASTGAALFACVIQRLSATDAFPPVPVTWPAVRRKARAGAGGASSRTLIDALRNFSCAADDDGGTAAIRTISWRDNPDYVSAGCVATTSYALAPELSHPPINAAAAALGPPLRLALGPAKAHCAALTRCAGLTLRLDSDGCSGEGRGLIGCLARAAAPEVTFLESAHPSDLTVRDTLAHTLFKVNSRDDEMVAKWNATHTDSFACQCGRRSRSVCALLCEDSCVCCHHRVCCHHAVPRRRWRCPSWALV